MSTPPVPPPSDASLALVASAAPAADDGQATPTLDAALSREIVALYREARGGDATDFKQAVLERARRLLPWSASTWVNGVLTDQGPVIHEASSVGLKPGFWEAMASFMARGEDPLGPVMYAAPGRSFVTQPDFFSAEFNRTVHVPYDVHSALTGLSLDPSTRIFSAVCFHRNVRMPVFNESDRRLHEHLLPHWLEGLALYRVTRAARAAELAWAPGHKVAVIDTDGVIHHAQPGFGELLTQELRDWRGAVLPRALVDALQHTHAYEGTCLRAQARPVDGNLWVIELAAHRARPDVVASPAAARDDRLLHMQRQLELVPGELAEQQRRQAVVDERQRIMRELHDGVGSHLVGLLNLAQRGTLDSATIEDAVSQALDEMRMAVDSMQTGDLDVVTALANLRYRLQPRFDHAGITVAWHLDVEIAPPFAVGDVFQWQRILLEAFTNLLKHSRANQASVTARATRDDDGDAIEVEIRDEGVGMGVTDPTRGHGLRNMHHRARAIGARLDIEPNLPVGTVIRLRWPCDNAASESQVAAITAVMRPMPSETDSDFGRLL